MTRTPFVITVILALSLSSLPAWASESEYWAAGYDHTNSSSETKGYFFRFDMKHATCVSLTRNTTFAPGAPTPSVMVAIAGKVHAVGGYEAEAWGGYLAYIWGPPEEYGDTRFLLNGGLGEASVVHTDESSGYDEPHRWLWSRGTTTTCFAPTDARAPPAHYWLTFLVTGPMTQTSASLRFCESFDRESFSCVTGAAQGRVYYAADTETTFFKRLKDFDGTFAYDGDPLDITGGPNAAAANVETSINVDRGFVGGFHSFRGTSVLSYEGPGIQRFAEPASTVGLLAGTGDVRYIAGSPGEWKFKVHAYAAPQAYSQVFVYGMDIDPAKWVLPPPTQDEDEDLVSDAAEPGICGIEDFNDPTDGTCDEETRDYRPPTI